MGDIHSAQSIERIDLANEPDFELGGLTVRPRRTGGPAERRSAGFLAWQQRSVATEPTSIAVLPFRNLSEDKSYFAEGVGEEIMGQLANSEPPLQAQRPHHIRALRPR